MSAFALATSLPMDDEAGIRRFPGDATGEFAIEFLHQAKKHGSRIAVAFTGAITGHIMKRHHYKVTLEHLADPEGNVPGVEPMQFEVMNHDDIFAMVEKLAGSGRFDGDTSRALVVGLKLFGEVMLENKQDPLFANLRPHFAEFMRELKKSP